MIGIILSEGQATPAVPMRRHLMKSLSQLVRELIDILPSDGRLSGRTIDLESQDPVVQHLPNFGIKTDVASVCVSHGSALRGTDV